MHSGFPQQRHLRDPKEQIVSVFVDMEAGCRPRRTQSSVPPSLYHLSTAETSRRKKKPFSGTSYIVEYPHFLLAKFTQFALTLW